MILTLWVVMGLVAVTLLFSQSALFEYRGETNRFYGYQSEAAVEGGIRYAMSVLSNLEEPGQVPDVSAYVSQEVEVGDARLWFLGRDWSVTAAPGRDPVFGFVDEASKLSLNTATVEMLQKLPNMTVEFAAAIVDWRDEDDEVTDYGAESSTYAMESPPYEAKNAPFTSTYELLAVQGATPQILFGEDTNLNGVLDENENDGDLTPPPDNADGALDLGILEYVTVHSLQPGEEEDDEDQEGLVNVGTAPLEVLACLPGMDESLARQLVSYRGSLGTDALSSTDWVEEVLEGDVVSQIEDLITSASYQFCVDVAAVGRHGGGYRRTRAIVDVSGDSPALRYREDMTRYGWALGETVRLDLAEEAPRIR